MAELRLELITRACENAQFYGDRIGDDFNETYEEQIKYVESITHLTKEEKVEANNMLTEYKDYHNFFDLKEQVYLCEKCKRSGYTMRYCEHCLRDSLRKEFPNWTSGNSTIDNTIRESQMALPLPKYIVEWIPYKDLVDIKYMTKAGFADIYAATWLKGRIGSFDKDTQTFNRFGTHRVTLKQLNKSSSPNSKFLHELQTYIQCWLRNIVSDFFGVTRDPDTGDFILVLDRQEEDLRNFAFKNDRSIRWKDLYNLFWYISGRLYDLHSEGFVHRDLHSGNILRSIDGRWFISDLGLCGQPNQPENTVYGNLPFMAPEILTGKRYTSAVDIYSFGMLMYEVSTGRPPFYKRKHDVHLQFDIIDGERPEIPNTLPEDYRKLMEKCWDAIPENRPAAEELADFFYSKRNLCFTNEGYYAQLIQRSVENVPTIPPASQSSLYTISSGREPRNATSKEQEDFDSHQSSLFITGSFDGLTLRDKMDYSTFK